MIVAQLRTAKERIQAIHNSVDEEQAVTRGVLQEAQQRGVLIDQLKRDLAAATAEAEVHDHDHAECAHFPPLSARRHIGSLRSASAFKLACILIWPEFHHASSPHLCLEIVHEFICACEACSIKIVIGTLLG